MNLIDTGQGYIELRDDGTYRRHPYRFVQTGHDLIRYTYDDAVKVIHKEFYEPHDLMTVDAETGQILQIQTGFVVEHELVLPEHPDPDKRYVQVRASKYPADFRDATTGVLRYRMAASGAAFELRSSDEMKRDIARAR